MSFQQGLSGLDTASAGLDTIGNNVANSGTVGFKQSTTQFADVFAASLSGAGASPVGLGAKVAGVAQQFTQGNISVTSNPLDMAINGGGFFRLQNATGDVLYTRNGQFQLDKDGFIVNAKGQELMGYNADVSGAISTTLAPLRLFDPATASDAKPQATGGSATASGVQANVNLDSTKPPIAATFDPTIASTYTNSTAVTVYDSLGNSHTMTMFFQKTAAGAWNLYTTLDNDPATVSAATPIQFDSTGALATSGTPPVITAPPGGIVAESFAVTTGATSPMTFNLNLTGSTQFGSSFAVNTMIQDGFASGKLAGFSIGTDGVVVGRYTNGQSKNLGQVVLANFRNPQGLQPVGDNSWVGTSTSGSEMIGSPGSSSQFGPVQSAALEDSNVDLTKELVAMIVQQRAYQANAETIKTQDQVLQTLVSLR